MPVLIAVCRIAHCMMCGKEWQLLDGATPSTCRFCGSKTWEWGPVNQTSRRIRQGIKRNTSTRGRRAFNAGAASKKRQEWGRKQYRRFHTKEQDDAIEAAKKAKAVDESAKPGEN